MSREISQRRLRSRERLTVAAEDIPRKAEFGNEGGEQVLRRRERALLCELCDGLLLGGGHGARRSGRLEAWMLLQSQTREESSEQVLVGLNFNLVKSQLVDSASSPKRFRNTPGFFCSAKRLQASNEQPP